MVTLRENPEGDIPWGCQEESQKQAQVSQKESGKMDKYTSYCLESWQVANPIGWREQERIALHRRTTF